MSWGSGSQYSGMSDQKIRKFKSSVRTEVPLVVAAFPPFLLPAAFALAAFLALSEGMAGVLANNEERVRLGTGSG